VDGGAAPAAPSVPRSFISAYRSLIMCARQQWTTRACQGATQVPSSPIPWPPLLPRRTPCTPPIMDFISSPPSWSS